MSPKCTSVPGVHSRYTAEGWYLPTAAVHTCQLLRYGGAGSAVTRYGFIIDAVKFCCFLFVNVFVSFIGLFIIIDFLGGEEGAT